MDEALKRLAGMLRLAERAHANAELSGYKGEWPEFYAQFILDNSHVVRECEDGSCEVHDHGV